MSTTDLFSVAGKSVLITGGSRGIGRMLAEGFLRGGARVIISARKTAELEATAAELSALGDVHAVTADLSTAEGATTLAAATAERFPELHVLINNAGASWGAALGEYPEAGVDRVLDTNVKGIFLLTQDLLPQLRAAATPADPARVINIGSVDGIRAPLMQNYSYSASKAAVHQLTKHLAKHLAHEAITVNAIAPGPFESKMTAFVLSDEESRRAVAGTIPLGRIGEPDDIAGTAIFLSSKAGSYLTGVVIPVDGGYSGAG